MWLSQTFYLQVLQCQYLHNSFHTGVNLLYGSTKVCLKFLLTLFHYTTDHHLQPFQCCLWIILSRNFCQRKEHQTEEKSHIFFQRSLGACFPQEGCRRIGRVFYALQGSEMKNVSRFVITFWASELNTQTVLYYIYILGCKPDLHLCNKTTEVRTLLLRGWDGIIKHLIGMECLQFLTFCFLGELLGEGFFIVSLLIASKDYLGSGKRSMFGL